MSQPYHYGRYDPLEPHPPLPEHDPRLSENYPARDNDSMNLPQEDLDFDLPPGAGRPRFYQSEFGGPQPLNPSFADSFDARTVSRQASQSSFLPLPAHNPDGRGSSYGPSPLYQHYRDDPSQVSMAPLGLNRDFGHSEIIAEKRAMYGSPKKERRKTWLLVGGIILLLLIIGAVIGVYFGVIRPKHASSSASSPTGSKGGSSDGTKNLIVTGGDGSKITMDDGTSFTYSNQFGGIWWSDPNSPFMNNAQAQTYTPPLNQSFKWGQDRIYGVNLGGWLNTEPFITPALYQKYQNNSQPAVDEWTLSLAMAADTAGGGLKQLEDHYKTFITEKDFAEIAGAGLNFVRIPVPYWAIEVRDNEPFLGGVAWKYFLKAINWARKYGLRINLDFHALPGSQNGWNHSGRLGSLNVLNGVMGLANAQRSLTYIRILAEFISQPQYKDVVVMFGITNEPQASVVGQDALSSYYLEAYNIVRSVGGIGEGKGPMISIHEGFLAPSSWAGFLPNSDRIALDTHPYFAFGGQSPDPIASYAPKACSIWGPNINGSMGAFGMTAAGEFSLATNDCGLFVNGVNLGTRYEATYQGGPTTAIGSCDKWNHWETYTDDTKNQLKTFALASMDALQNWFFWNWKIANSTVGRVESPFWSYKLGVDNGWLPKDPREAAGACNGNSPWKGPLAPWQTGGVGAGNIPPSATAQFPWPPATISNAGPVSLLPQYTETGSVPTLPVPTFTPVATSVTISAGNGWVNPQDTESAYVPISGCSYPNPWSGVGAPMPTAPCGGGGPAAAPPSPPPAATAPPVAPAAPAAAAPPPPAAPPGAAPPAPPPAVAPPAAVPAPPPVPPPKRSAAPALRP